MATQKFDGRTRPIVSTDGLGGHRPEVVIFGGGGGGGGAATIADGADITQGALADAAVVGDNAGSLSAKLRGLNKILNDVWSDPDNALGIIGRKSNNGGAPGATNLGTLSGVATAADPTYTEGNQVALSTNLAGHLRACVNGFAADGASAVGNPVLTGLLDTGSLAQSIRAIRAADGTAGAGLLGAGVMALNTSAVYKPIGCVTGNGDGVAGGVVNWLQVWAQNQLFNETSNDRMRANTDVAVLGSNSRTTTQAITFTAYNSLYLTVVADVTVAGTGSITITIERLDTASGKWTVLLSGAAITTVSTNIYKVGPGLPVTANVSANDILGRNMRIVVTHNNANAITYSVGRQLTGT